MIFKAVESDYATQRDVSRRKRDIKTIGLKLKVDNPDGALVPGMTAEVLLPKDLTKVWQKARNEPSEERRLVIKTRPWSGREKQLFLRPE